MPITPEGRFIPVNMDRCQDLMGRGGAVRARYTGLGSSSGSIESPWSHQSIKQHS